MMARQVLLCILAASCVLVSCKRILPMRPELGIKLESAGSDYVVSFTNCLNDQPLPIDEVGIYKNGDGPRGLPALCELVSTQYGQHVLNSWTYGTTPPGYRLGKCAAMSTGETYEIHASGSGDGVRRFQLQNGGEVKALEPVCR